MLVAAMCINDYIWKFFIKYTLTILLWFVLFTLQHYLICKNQDTILNQNEEELIN